MRALALGLLLLVATPALAKDHAEELEEKFAKLDKKLAGMLVTTGRWAKGKKLFSEAAESFVAALGYDPDNKTARKLLGYTGEPGNWAKTESVESVTKLKSGKKLWRLEDQYEEKRWKSFGKKATKEFTKIAEWCEKEGDSEGMKRAWGRLLSIDPDARRARIALDYQGFKSGDDEGWMTGEVWDAIKDAPGGEEVSENPVATRMGKQLAARQSEGLFLTGTIEQKRLELLIACGELARQHMHSLLGKPAKESRVEIAFFATQNDFYEWLRVHRPKESEEEAKRRSKNSGSFSSVDDFFGYRVTDPWDQEDAVIRRVSYQQLLQTKGWATSFPWLQQGFSAYLTVRQHDSTVFYSVGAEGTRAPGADRIGDHHDWPLRLRGLIAIGQDPSLEDLLKLRKVNHFSKDHLAKSWSVINFLLAEHRKAFVDWVKVIPKEIGKGGDPVPDFELGLGKSVEEIDAAWKAWVLKNY